MVVAEKVPCPNCGKIITRPATTAPTSCLHCGEEIGIGADNKLVLLRPIARYRDLGEEVRDSSTAQHHFLSEQPPTLAEYRRKMASVERALERVEEEIRQSTRNKKSGIILILFGVLFGLYLLARVSIAEASWIDWIAPALISAGFSATGVYLVASAATLTRSSQREQKDLRKELELIRGKVAHDS